MIRSYSKRQQLGYDVSSPEAQALLKKAARRKREIKVKYGNRYTVHNGRTYDSGMEAEYAGFLDFQLKARTIKAWKPQKLLELRANGELITKYFIDFMVIHNDDRVELIEVKGAETRDWMLKWRLTKALLPKGEIPGIPKDSLLTLVKKGKRGFIHQPQLLEYTE